MKHSKTDYRGGEAITLSTKALELTVTTSVGPRIVSLRSLKGGVGNLFLQFPEDEQRYHGYYLRGGHRLWHAPEHIVRTYQPDDSPLTVNPLANGIALAQPVEEKTGVRKTLQIELKGERTVLLTHALTNEGLWPIETSAWALTMLRGDGYGVLPLPPKGNHADGDLLPAYALVPWSYTDLAAPVWQLRRDCIGIDVAKAAAAHKLGITNYPGWSAYWLDGITFVKYSPVETGATYPDMGCAFETFTDGKMIEFETLGPLTRLAPGESLSHIEHWTVLDGMEKPDTDAGFAALAKAVGRWIKTLG